MKNKTTTLITCELLVALSAAGSMIKLWQAPYGGSVTLLAMIPLIAASCLFGVKWGVATGFVASCVQLVLGLSNIAYVPTAWGMALCIFLDYIAAYTVIGFSGFLCPKGYYNLGGDNKISAGMILKSVAGAAVCIAVRYACHVVSGAVIWYSLDKIWYEDDAAHIVNRFGAWAFSVIYNGTFMLPEAVLTLAVLPSVLKISAKLRSRIRQ